MADIHCINLWDNSLTGVRQMDFFEIQDIGEANFEIFSPCTTDGLIEVGTYLGLSNSSRVIDFGCGTGELLAIWAQKLGISGLGIDIRESCHKRAVTKIRNLNLAKRIQMIHGMATQYPIENREYDVAVCIASSYTWGGFVQAIAGMSRAIRPVGKLVIGEPYWVTGRIDSHICSKEPFFTERELLDIARYQGFDLEFMFRASRDDLDNYESRLWRG